MTTTEYDAHGIKLKKIDSNGETTDYEEDDIYVNGVLYQTSHDEGRIVDGIYEYNITDHLGNLRVSFKDSSGITKITQVNAYGAWGLSMKGMQITRNSTNFNHYQFLNRETQFETGYIDLIHRQFDPQIGRFISQDGVIEGQEHLSLYQYSWNNPVLRSDPDGDYPCCGGVTDFVMGFTHAFNQDVSPIPGTSLVRSDGGRNYSNGAGLGHRAALIVGVLEVGAGIGGDAAAVVGEAVSFGAATPAAIPLAIGSTGLILHGGSTISKSLDNMKSEGGMKQRSKPKEDGTPSTSEIQSKDKSGKTDKYTTYDSNGKIEKEYQGSGKDHGNIPRPNVKEPKYNTNPQTGEKFKNGYEVRKARTEEIPK